jgi:hypothetical protein
MQIIKSYTHAGSINARQQLRLYHFTRPRLQQWRRTRHGQDFQPDQIDQWILNNVNSDHVVAVDFAGWYLELFGIKTICLESSNIAKLYWTPCYVEPDIMTWRPTYISESDTVIFRNPGFLRYATVDQFVAFLELWVKSTTVLNFNPVFIQHNHLKFRLIDLIKQRVPYNIDVITEKLWVIKPCTNNK